MDDLVKLAFAVMGIYLIYQLGQQGAGPYMTPYYAPYFAPYWPLFSQKMLTFPGGGFRPPMRPEGGPEFGSGFEIGGEGFHGGGDRR